MQLLKLLNHAICTPALRSLHWLRTHQIQAPLTRLEDTFSHPISISSWCCFCSTSLQHSLLLIACRQRLRSAGYHQLFLPRYQHSLFGRRAFSVAGPSAWNSLPDYLWDASRSFDSFRQDLGTFLYTQCIRGFAIMHYINLLLTWHNTLSSSLITLACSPTSSSLCIMDCSFRYASPCLWSQLPACLRQPHASLSVTDSPTIMQRLSNQLVSPVDSPLSPFITRSMFHSWLKTHLFHKSFPP